MEYMLGLKGFKIEEDTAVTLGKFDGLHRGHQKLMNRILQLETLDCKSVVFTLNSRRSGGVLLTDQERRKMLEEKGISYMVDCPFVPEIAEMEPEMFIIEVLVKQLHAKYVVVGEDFRFGHDRKGDYRTLQEMQKLCGYQVDVIKKEQYQGRDISSSYIKDFLKKGDMELVNCLLGYPFFVSGEVLHGRQIGRTIGIPTTNLVPTTRKLLPPNGVYVSATRIGNKVYQGVTNIGYKPTIGETFRGVETYLFDFDGDLYGEDIEVQLLAFERPEMKFGSVEELTNRMKMDISFGKEYFCE